MQLSVLVLHTVHTREVTKNGSGYLCGCKWLIIQYIHRHISLSTQKDMGELWLECCLHNFHTSKTLKDMNSDSFTLSPHNRLLWLNNGSSNTPVALQPLTMIRWPLPCHSDMLYIHHRRLRASALRDPRGKVMHRGRSKGRQWLRANHLTYTWNFTFCRQ